MKVKTLVGFKCPECEEFVAKDDIPEVVTLYQCGECEEVYDEREEAKECCRD